MGKKVIITLIMLSLLLSSAGQGYALRPMSAKFYLLTPAKSFVGGEIDYPSCGKLERIGTKPLFEAREDATIIVDGKPVKWEKLVYNAGALKIDGITYVLYRALGFDNISRIGLWTSKDGINEELRLDYPIFGPEATYELPKNLKARRKRYLKEYGMVRELGGTEDPRLTIIGDTIYMLYTAYGEIAQIAMASITIRDFLDQNWNGWKRQGLVFPGVNDKDAILIDSKNGLYLFHRMGGKNIYSMRFDSMDKLLEWIEKAKEMNAKKVKGYVAENSNLLLEPRPEIDDKIGAGAQILKTKYGWLNIYHAVEEINGESSYTLRVLLTDLRDPEKIIYRSPGTILVPEEKWEKEGWVPNVVFTCGAVPRNKNSNEILDENDDVLIFYGGADKVMGVAVARIKDLIPEEIRKNITFSEPSTIETFNVISAFKQSA